MISEPENNRFLSEERIKRMHHIEDIIRSLCAALGTQEAKLLERVAKLGKEVNSSRKKLQTLSTWAIMRDKINIPES